MSEKIISDSILNSYPAQDHDRINSLLQEEFRHFNKKIVVLDDDPTGIQTVHDVPVYTDWAEESIYAGFKGDSQLFFILTNSRSFSEDKTKAVHAEIAKRILEVSKKCGKDFVIVSRGDSTLRGHYPLETEILRETLGKAGINTDFEIIVPFFPEGNRFTLNDIHYVRQNGDLVPAGMTEFARDKTFAYTASNLKEWCEEKSAGKTKAEDVVSISLDELRNQDYSGIEHKLLQAHDFGKVIINAISYDDLSVFTVALLRVLRRGKHCIFRSAAAMVKVLGNISDRPLLTAKDILTKNTENGGIILVGSHVKKTTMQLEALHSLPEIQFVEFNQHRVLEVGGLEDEVKKISSKAESLITQGKTLVVFTRRERLDFPDGDPEKNLEMAVAISDAVTSVISSLTVQPAFIIAKGGITSSDVGTKALRVKKAIVMGQIAPGVPVWQTGEESKFPFMPYVIFPGNVGDEYTLRNVVDILTGGKSCS